MGLSGGQLHDREATDLLNLDLMGAQEGAHLSCAPQTLGSCSSVEEVGFEGDVIMAMIDKDGVILQPELNLHTAVCNRSSTCAPQ